jgi:hypothetical protein
MTAKSLLGLSIGALLATGCAASEEPQGDGICEAGKCDGAFLDQLKNRQDPIANYFRSLAEQGVIDSAGVYKGAKGNKVEPTNDPLFYAKLLTGIAKVQGCDPASLINYALSDDLISGDVGKVFPRLVSTLCSNDPDKATNAFVATLGMPADDGDIALDDLEMFAWDPVASNRSRSSRSAARSVTRRRATSIPSACRGCRS